MEKKGLTVNLGKTKVMKCEARYGQTEKLGKWLCGILRSTFSAVSGFMEGAVVYLIKCRMRLVPDVRGV